MKIFVVSDIHGHATLLKNVLEKAGFQSGSEEHLLVCCGDCFDRGSENAEVLAFLESIPNKVIIGGNHEQMLGDMMEKASVSAVAAHNGTTITLQQFFGENAIARDGSLSMPPRKKKRIKEFLDQTVDFFETKNYIFVHGWIALGMKDRYLMRDPYWRQSSLSEWRRARWHKWYELYSYSYLAPMEEKTMICGHCSAEYGIYFDSTRPQGSTLPFFGKNLVAIDACTILSHRINLLLLEDDLLTRTHAMKLRKEHFDAVRSGKKTVEMRLLDEKRERLRIGDTIEFRCEETDELLCAKVYGLYSYPSFEELVKDFTPSSLGFPRKHRQYVANYMKKIYKEEDRCGMRTLAIRIKVQ